MHLCLLWLIVANLRLRQFHCKDVLIADRWRAPLTMCALSNSDNTAMYCHNNEHTFVLFLLLSLLLFSFYSRKCVILRCSVHFWQWHSEQCLVTWHTHQICCYFSVPTCAIWSRKRKSSAAIRQIMRSKWLPLPNWHWWRVNTKAAHLRFPFTCPSLLYRIGISLVYLSAMYCSLLSFITHDFMSVFICYWIELYD